MALATKSGALWQMSRAEKDEGWTDEGHAFVGREVVRSTSATAQSVGTIYCWLPPTVEDCYEDEDGKPAPLFKVRFLVGELDGDVEDLGEHEMAAALQLEQTMCAQPGDELLERSEKGASGYAGVHRKHGKWRAYLTNSRTNIGCFETALEAARARREGGGELEAGRGRRRVVGERVKTTTSYIEPRALERGGEEGGGSSRASPTSCTPTRPCRPSPPDAPTPSRTCRRRPS